MLPGRRRLCRRSQSSHPERVAVYRTDRISQCHDPLRPRRARHPHECELEIRCWGESCHCWPHGIGEINCGFTGVDLELFSPEDADVTLKLVLSLLRFTHIISGQVLYDEIDITRIPRRRLRESLTIIPQEAVLFNGTVETNLDPTETISKQRLERALLSCKDIASFQHQSTGNANTDASLADCRDNGLGRENSLEHAQPPSGIALATLVAPKGENFSHGQRQVLSLCRALLRKSRLMLLDEATASMDYETDRGIQDVLRRELGSDGTGDRTLVTIAHRLRTIVDYDKIVVMGEGKVVEVGAPKELYDRGGTFYDMVCHSGEGSDLERILKGRDRAVDR